METYQDGGTFIGNFREGQPEGHGKLTSFDGSVYEGEFRKGLKHGRGKWTIPIVLEREVCGKVIRLKSDGEQAEWTGTIENNVVVG